MVRQHPIFITTEIHHYLNILWNSASDISLTLSTFLLLISHTMHSRYTHFGSTDIAIYLVMCCYLLYVTSYWMSSGIYTSNQLMMGELVQWVTCDIFQLWHHNYVWSASCQQMKMYISIDTNCHFEFFFIYKLNINIPYALLNCYFQLYSAYSVE